MAGPASNARVPGEERVFSLVLALVASPQGLSKSELLSSVYGYAGRDRSGGVERQFERDKEQVRQLGIPIETFDAPGSPGDNRLTRYRISKDRLQLPASVRFSAEELTVLRLASLAWSDGSLGSESRWASMKLASLGAGLDVRHLGIAPRIGMAEPSAPALQRAIDEGLIARFEYQLPQLDAPLARTVAPLRLHRAEGRWHLIAWDLDREDDRVFLLSRIASEVRLGPERIDLRLAERVDAALERLLSLREHQRAVVRAVPGSIAEARLEPRADGGGTNGDRERASHELVIGTLDLHALADELAGYGDEVAVRSPATLRDEVVSLLRTVRDQHSDPRTPMSRSGAAHA